MLLTPDKDNILPELILLPGLDGTGKLFEPLIKALNGRMNPRVVSYPATEPLGYDQLIKHVTNCIPKGKPFVILGESFSGPLAVMAAAQKPENLVGIILSASFVKFPVPGFIEKLQWVIDSKLLSIRPRKTAARLLAGRKCKKTSKKWIMENLPAIHTEVLRTRIYEVLKVNVREQLKGIDVPLLYIGGARDRLMGKKALDTIWICRPDVQVRIFDTGHMVLQCEADRAAEAIVEFSGKLIAVPILCVPRGQGS